MVRKPLYIPKRPEHGLLHHVFHFGKCTRPFAKLEVNQNCQTPLVFFERSRERIDASVAELQEERDAVQELGLLG